MYRRDAIDRLHTGTPHQLDLWRVAGRPLGNADRDEVVALLAGALAPGKPVHPDLSVAVDGTDAAEGLGDRVRDHAR